MASTTFSSAVLEQSERPPPASSLGALVIAIFIAGLAAGVVGFVLLATGNVGWARTLFVGDLIAMVGSVAVSALAPRSDGRVH